MNAGPDTATTSPPRSVPVEEFARAVHALAELQASWGETVKRLAVIDKRIEDLWAVNSGAAVHDLVNFIQNIPDTVQTLRQAATAILDAHQEQKKLGKEQRTTAIRLELLEARIREDEPE